MALFATGTGSSTSRSVWMATNHLPPELLTVMFLAVPRMSRLAR
jgi:hypothetical protein